jgi:hypothetical protein
MVQMPPPTAMRSVTYVMSMLQSAPICGAVRRSGNSTCRSTKGAASEASKLGMHLKEHGFSRVAGWCAWGCSIVKGLVASFA